MFCARIPCALNAFLHARAASLYYYDATVPVPVLTRVVRRCSIQVLQGVFHLCRAEHTVASVPPRAVAASAVLSATARQPAPARIRWPTSGRTPTAVSSFPPFRRRHRRRHRRLVRCRRLQLKTKKVWGDRSYA